MAAWLGHLLDKREGVGEGIVDLDAVFGVPVAGNDHPSAVQFKARTVEAFPVQTSVSAEGAGIRIIYFRFKTLSDAEILCGSATQEQFARRESDT